MPVIAEQAQDALEHMSPLQLSPYQLRLMSTCCQFHSQDKLNWSFSLRLRTLVLYEFMALELLCQLTCQSGILCLLSQGRVRRGRGGAERCLCVALSLFVVAVYVTAMRSEPFTVHTIFLSAQLGAARV